MKTTIGVYENHDLALNAVIELKDAGYPVKHISIMGKAQTEVVDNELHVSPKPLALGGLAVGAIAGTAVGVLTGVGLFVIPGLGVLMGAGAVVGAIAGFDFGLIGGGLLTVLVNLGIHEDAAKIYHKILEEGKFLVIVHGNEDEIKQATEILTNHGTHLDLQAHTVAEEISEEEKTTKKKEREDFLARMNSQFPLSGGERGF